MPDPKKESDAALKEIAGRILQMSNRALAKMVEQEGPLGEAAAAELERRELLGQVREMEDEEIDAIARGDDPRAELANAEIVRRRHARAREAAETTTAAVRGLVLEIDQDLVRLVVKRMEHYERAIASRYGTGLPLHDGAVTNAIAAALVEALEAEGVDRTLAQALAQTLNGICRRYAESQVTEG